MVGMTYEQCSIFTENEITSSLGACHHSNIFSRSLKYSRRWWNPQSYILSKLVGSKKQNPKELLDPFCSDRISIGVCRINLVKFLSERHFLWEANTNLFIKCVMQSVFLNSEILFLAYIEADGQSAHRGRGR